MQKMFEAVVNSPKTELVVAITEVDTEIEVSDSSVLLQPEGLAVIGNGEGAETIKYTEVDGNVLKGCIRGFQGTAKPWAAGTRLARNFTAYDHDAFKANIEQHDTDITALSDRLDTAENVPVTLQPGLQVIHSERDTRFRLREVKGRTLINLLGAAGDCENVNLWAHHGSAVVLDVNNKTVGSSSMKVTASGTVGSFAEARFNFDATKHYIVVADIKNIDAQSSSNSSTSSTVCLKVIIPLSSANASVDGLSLKASFAFSTTSFNCS